MLLTKYSNASNVGNTATGPGTADPPSCLTSPTVPTPSQDFPTTSHQDHSQSSQLSNIEEDLAQVQGSVEKFEVESGCPLNVKGNLRVHIDFWKSIGAPNFILLVIENGYRLPFASFPEPVKLKNNKSARLNADFVDEAIRELVLSGRVCEVSQEPLVVNPLSVSIQPCGKKRLILDLRHVNKCLVKQRVKYEDLEGCSCLFCKRFLHVFLRSQKRVSPC